MGSGNKDQSVLELLVGTIELFKTFGSVFFWVNSIFNQFDGSGPLDLFLIILMSNRLVVMGKWEILKIGVILLELFVNFSIIDGLDLDSLPIFVLIVGSVLFEGHNLLEDLFGDWIAMDKLVVNDGVVVTTIDRRVLAAEHVHFGVC